MSTNVIQPSFAAGELSPTLHARVDLAKYHVGAALMENMFVDYRGGASNRAGSLWVGQGRDSTQDIILQPFQFSVEQAYMLEFSHQRMRVIMDGGYVLEPAKNITGITQANPGVLTSNSHGFAEGDTVFVTGVVGMTQVNDRFYRATNVTANTLELRKMNVNPNTSPTSDNVNTTGYNAYSSGGTVARVFTLTTPYDAADLRELGFSQNADVLTVTHERYLTRDISRTDHHLWTIGIVQFKSAVNAPSGITVTYSSGGNAQVYYKITALSEDGEESLPTLFIADGANDGNNHGLTLKWTPVPGAIGYNIYRSVGSTHQELESSQNGSIARTFGFVEFTQAARFSERWANDMASFHIQADLSKTPPKAQNPFAVKPIKYVTVTNGGNGYTRTSTIQINDSTGSGAVLRPVVNAGVLIDVVVEQGGENYTAPSLSINGGTGATMTATLGDAEGMHPAVSTYFQQRQAFGGSINRPDGFNMSKTGFRKNMDTSSPARDDDAISGNVASQQVNNIVSMVPMPGGLVMLTGGGAIQVSGGGSMNEPITPANAVGVPQSYNGAARMPAIVINNNILFVQRERSVIRNLQYDFFANIYTGTDLTVLASHMFFGKQIISWAYAEEPFKLIWIALDDGTFVSLTYLREQEVIGFARHYTQGKVKSFASIAEGTEIATYIAVDRLVGGNWLTFVERFAQRNFKDPEGNYAGVDAGWFLDAAVESALTYPNGSITPAAASGTGIICTANSAMFTSADIGKVLRLPGGARGTVTAQNGNTITVTFDREIPEQFLSEEGEPDTFVAGEWSLTAKISTLDGLWHLEGRGVRIIGDGQVLDLQVVTNGSVPLKKNNVTFPVSWVRAGLGYRASLQTLPLDLSTASTVQGKRKKLGSVTVIASDTMGLKAGSTFDTCRAFKFQGKEDGNARMVTGKQRHVLDPNWTVEGQMCFLQENPLPVSILGVIPEIVVGDTAR